jgi:hypothetical protein
MLKLSRIRRKSLPEMSMITHSINNKKKRAIIITVATTLLVLGFYLFTAYHNNLWPFWSDSSQQSTQESDNSKNAQEQQTTYNQNKQALIESETPTDATDSQKKIIMASKQEDNGTLTIFTKLYGYSDGVCTLKVSNGSHTSSQTASIIFQSEYSTCAGFSVPIAENGTGTWTIDLIASSNGQSDTEQILVEVK